MVQLDLVEKHPFARMRMPDHRRAARAGLQRLLVQPVPLAAGSGQSFFDLSAAIRLEKVLPAHIQSRHKSTHIQQPPGFKFIHQIRRQSLQHLAAIDDGRGATHARRQLAEKPLLARPALQMGTFIVVEDHLPLGIGRRTVDIAPAFFFRQVTVAAVQFGFYGFDKRFELPGRSQPEITKQNRRMPAQRRLDKLALAFGPGGRIEIGAARLDDQRQGLLRAEKRPAHALAGKRRSGCVTARDFLELIEFCRSG